MTKQNLLELIEDYAAAKSIGRPALIQYSIMRLDQAVELMFTQAPAPTGDGNQQSIERERKDADPT